ncbi:MAG: outer membrane protein assembly factor BamD [Bacteroidaceae bacterium]|nr:outer membrane protein assembly factor BamD [Candidatus Colenecus caballi]MCQ2072423.1 outer membrane protein assembly factor BamD [Bacteroidaceae bacterium]
MRKTALQISVLTLFLVVFSGCSGYNKIQKASDFNTKYSLAKAQYMEGRYTTCSSVLEECVAYQRGTAQAEESMFLLASCYYNLDDYLSASQYYLACYTSYPNSVYSEECLFRSGKSLFKDTPDPRLDATSTNHAIRQLQRFVETYPASSHRAEAEQMIYTMYDRLVEKEKGSAELYYNMGNYLGNNYRSCIIVSQNALRDYPYTKYREDLSMLILKAKFQMAQESVIEKRDDRYRDAIDEYYAFRNEFPESKYMKEAERILRVSTKNLGNKNQIIED